MISPRKNEIFRQNCLLCGQFGQNNCRHWLWKVAQIAINRPIWSHWRGLKLGNSQKYHNHIFNGSVWKSSGKVEEVARDRKVVSSDPKTRYKLIIFKNVPIPAYFYLFSFFSNNLQNKNCWLQRDWNTDHWTRRQGRWPLYHHYGPLQAYFYANHYHWPLLSCSLLPR